MGWAPPAGGAAAGTARRPEGGTGFAGLAALVAAYLSLNASLNLLNRWSLGVWGFRFPLILTSCHMALSFAVLAPLAARRRPWHAHRATLARHWRGVAAVGACLALSIALNNISLQDLSLTLNQVIRSAIPVVTCLLAVVVERRRPSRREGGALALLTGGVMTAVWQQGRVAGHPAAVLACLASTLCSGAMMTFSGRALGGERLDAVRLGCYTAPVSLACLLPFALRFERAAFAAFLAAHPIGVAAVVGATSANAIAYNLVHSLMIQRTSAVATTVLGEVKVLALLALSAGLLGEARLFTPPFLAGCAAALCGLALYSHEQLRKLQAAMQPRIVSLVAAGVGAPLPSGRRPPSGLQRGPGAGRIRDPLSQRISPIRQQQRQKQHQGGAAAAPKLLQILPGGAGGGDCPPPLVAVH